MSSPSLHRKRGNRSNGNAPKYGRIGIYGGLILGFVCGLTFLSQSSSEFVLMEDLQRSLSSTGGTYLRFQEPQQPLATTTANADPGKYVPLVCPQVLEKARSSEADKNDIDPNKGILHGKQIEMDPKFWVSLHNKEFDSTRWDIMRSGHYYEKALSNAFVEVLKSTPAGSRVLDVGGNIGFFTLLSAANGPVTVETFEPNPKNQLRMCESLLLNHWHSEYDTNFYGDPKHVSRVNLYPFGAGRSEGVFSFEENDRNPGQGKFYEQQGVPGSRSLQVLTLDNFARARGWFESRPDIAILKVDVEGMEYSVIEGAMELFQAKLVRNIFMEVSARTEKEMDVNKPSLVMLRKAGYKLHKVGGWRGPNKDVDFPQDENIADHIMKRTKQEQAKQLNLWWTIDE